MRRAGLDEGDVVAGLYAEHREQLHVHARDGARLQDVGVLLAHLQRCRLLTYYKKYVLYCKSDII